LTRKLKETQDAFKNLVIYCHDLEAASVADSKGTSTVLENDALKTKVSVCDMLYVNSNNYSIGASVII
jgi:hypothetical protein